MTTFDGDPSAGEAVDVRVDEQVDEHEAATDEAPEAVAEVADSEPAEEPAQEEDQQDIDPATALKAELRNKPGDWYVVHSYAGYENKVKANLETRVQNLTSGTTSSRSRCRPKRSPRSRTASASRSTARCCPATSWCGWI